MAYCNPIDNKNAKCLYDIVTAERENQHFLEIKQLRLTFEKVRYTPGLEIDLVNCVTDEMNGGKIIISQILPLASPEVVNESLKIFTKEIVFVGAREELSLRRKNGNKVPVDEWQTTDPHVIFGVSTDKNVRTWYLRNTEEKHDIISRAARKLHLNR